MKRKKLTLRQKKKSGTRKGPSRYRAKRDFLNKHGGMGIDYPDKPWK